MHSVVRKFGVTNYPVEIYSHCHPDKTPHVLVRTASFELMRGTCLSRLVCDAVK